MAVELQQMHSVNPATEERIATYPVHSDAKCAVAGAVHSQVDIEDLTMTEHLPNEREYDLVSEEFAPRLSW